MKIDKTVIREAKYLAVSCLCFSVLVQVVFLLLKKYDYNVLLGSIYATVLILFDFVYRGVTIQNALDKSPSEAEKSIRNSYRIRMLILAIFTVFAVLMPVFNTWALIATLLFPKIYYMCVPIFRKDLK